MSLEENRSAFGDDAARDGVVKAVTVNGIGVNTHENHGSTMTPLDVKGLTLRADGLGDVDYSIAAPNTEVVKGRDNTRAVLEWAHAIGETF